MGQALIKNVGGTVETYFLDRQVTSCTASLYSGMGGAQITSGGVTIDAVTTTIASQGTKGATTLSLASATGVVVGRRYLLGASAAVQPNEVVTVKDLTASTATLWAPLAYTHASGTAYTGTRVALTVTSTQASTLWWDGYCDFIPSTGDPVVETVDCVLRKIPEVLIDETDILDILPKAQKILDAEQDMKGAIKRARDEFLRIMGGKNRANCALGQDHFRRPCALTFWILRRYALGEAFQAEIELMIKERDFLIQNIQSSIPFDQDQDGVTEGANDGGYTVGVLGRA